MSKKWKIDWSWETCLHCGGAAVAIWLYNKHNQLIGAWSFACPECETADEAVKKLKQFGLSKLDQQLAKELLVKYFFFRKGGDP